MAGSNELVAPKRSLRGHILSAIKATFSSLPWAGGIASLIDDYVPKSTEGAIWKAVEYLNERVRSLGDRVNAEAVAPDEFSDTVKGG